MSKAIEPLTITVDPESELGRALETADESPVVLVRNGTRFRVIRDHGEHREAYDPERFRAGLRRIAGIITPEDAERIKESIYRGREEGTRPINRP